MQEVVDLSDAVADVGLTLPLPTFDEVPDDALEGIAKQELELLEVDNVTQFAKWAAGKWDRMQSLFEQGSPTNAGRGFLPVETLVTFLRENQFQGNPAEVLLEIERISPNREEAISPRSRDLEKGKLITLAQFLRLQRKCEGALVNLPMWDESSVRGNFLRALRQQRGCLLRAWRLDLDRGGSGKVLYADFVAACRRFGMHSAAKQIWMSLRPTGSLSPLEFRELDTVESWNLESFVETLWHCTGFDLNQTWQCIDLSDRGVVTLDEFIAGADQLGFEGDAALLFRGLDTSGMGRLWRDELDYMRAISLSSARSHRNSPPVGMLQSWACRQFGGTDAFLRQIGFTSDCIAMDVNAFAARLAAFGFSGDVVQTAATIAESGGGSQVLKSCLQSLLSSQGGVGSRRSSNVSLLSSEGSPRKNQQQRRLWIGAISRKAWSDSVDDFSSRNGAIFVNSRSYFSVPERLQAGRGRGRLRHGGGAVPRGLVGGGALWPGRRGGHAGRVDAQGEDLEQTRKKKHAKFRPPARKQAVGEYPWNDSLFASSELNSKKSPHAWSSREPSTMHPGAQGLTSARGIF